MAAPAEALKLKKTSGNYRYALDGGEMELAVDKESGTKTYTPCPEVLQNVHRGRAIQRAVQERFDELEFYDYQFQVMQNAEAIRRQVAWLNAPTDKSSQSDKPCLHQANCKR